MGENFGKHALQQGFKAGSDRQQTGRGSPVFTIWFTGLPGSGKTTLGNALYRELSELGVPAELLDGDEIRKTVTAHLGFSEKDREENIRIVSWISRFLMLKGVIPICCFVSPTEKIRNIAREIIGEEDLYMVYCNAPLEICEERDTKGLYRRAREGSIPEFTGITAPYEVPCQPDLILDTAGIPVPETVGRLLDHVLPHIFTKQPG